MARTGYLFYTLGLGALLLLTSFITAECVHHSSFLESKDPAEDSPETFHGGWWPWDKDDKDKDKKFKCPSLFGSFPDTTDCHYFYICMGGRGVRTKCPTATRFDKYRRRCLSLIIAICDTGEDDTTNEPQTTPETSTNLDETTKGPFVCPSWAGNFMHPDDCSKYYVCLLFVASEKSCPRSELFDGVKKKCRPAKDVHCGTRGIPTDAPEPEPDITTETEPETTTPEPELETTTPEPEPETTTKTRVTAPDTTCDSDDVDCIIDDLGETPDWFVCPEDMGSHPHPSSRKLFIFCLNWKPSVKKCGQDLIFSEDLRTCVNP